MFKYTLPQKSATGLADDIRIMITRDANHDLESAVLQYRGKEYVVNEDDTIGELLGPKAVTGTTYDASVRLGVEKVAAAVATITEYFESLLADPVLNQPVIEEEEVVEESVVEEPAVEE